MGCVKLRAALDLELAVRKEWHLCTCSNQKRERLRCKKGIAAQEVRLRRQYRCNWTCTHTRRRRQHRATSCRQNKRPRLTKVRMCWR